METQRESDRVLHDSFHSHGQQLSIHAHEQTNGDPGKPSRAQRVKRRNRGFRWRLERKLTLCGTFPKISTNIGLLVVGGLLGLISTLAVLTIKAGTILERTKRRINRANY